MPVQHTSETTFDGFLELSGGVNSGWVPALLPQNTLSFAWNCTVRGGFATHRPGKIRLPLQFKDSVVAKRVVEGKFQGGDYYIPDSGDSFLIASISGRLFTFGLSGETSVVNEVTVSAGTLTTAAFVMPAFNDSVTVQVDSTSNIFVNAPIQIGLVNYSVSSVDSAVQLTVVNVDGVAGTIVPVGTAVTYWDVNPALRNQVWMLQAEKWMIIQDGQSVPIFFDGASSRRSVETLGQIQAGEAMEYHRGRVAKVNPGGRTFSIGDIVYGSSGTPGEQFRDSVLYVKENTYLVGGGFFFVPGTYGKITFMRGMADLDKSLGQGPLMVGTAKAIFTCDLPTDRKIWQALTNPILSVAQVANGGRSQDSAVNVNGDLFTRANDGVRSLTQGQRDFLTSWGNVPVSREMNRLLPHDDESLLGYASGAYFDNRLLMTASPSYSRRGVFHRTTVALDFDVLSSMRDKKPAAWEGAWLGTNILKTTVGEYRNRERCMEWIVTGEGDIELWEQTKDATADKFNSEIPIKWGIETCDFFRKGQAYHELDLKRLMGGEIYVTDVYGSVNFRVLYKPDQHPCWTYWNSWTVCVPKSVCTSADGCLVNTINKPLYFPRMPFGMPSKECDETGTRRPYREGRTFQVRIEVIGHCKIRGMRLMAITIPEPAWADMRGNCQTIEYDTVNVT